MIEYTMAIVKGQWVLVRLTNHEIVGGIESREVNELKGFKL